jgi:uncharacterized lipoprotein
MGLAYTQNRGFPVIRSLFLAVLAVVAGGCAFTPQAVKISPTVNVGASQVGGGRDITLNVVDERPKKTLGTVGARGVGADISIEGDLVATVQRALSEGLSKLSFKPGTNRGASQPELRVEIRNLDYAVIVGFWAGTLRVDAGLKAICIKGAARPYERLHSGEFVESVQVVQPKESNEKYISAAVSEAVNSLLADSALVTCLAQ